MVCSPHFCWGSILCVAADLSFHYFSTIVVFDVLNFFFCLLLTHLLVLFLKNYLCVHISLFSLVQHGSDGFGNMWEIVSLARPLRPEFSCAAPTLWEVAPSRDGWAFWAMATGHKQRRLRKYSRVMGRCPSVVVHTNVKLLAAVTRRPMCPSKDK